ncbi:MAG: phosphate acyltransferase [Chlamydiales bacterium]|nr:phosphate acyltransferase [Chlamydiales bacterium]
MPIIGLDLMGGDTPALDLAKAIAKLFDGQDLPFTLALLGTPTTIKHFAAIENLNAELIPVEDVIELDEDPLAAVRSKKGASTSVGMQLLKKKRIDAFVSIGNTGALLISSKLHLEPLKRFSRPALLALMPTQKKPMAVLDVGANISSSPDHLLHFAKMGIAYQKTLGRANPKVALLNIGSEETKGRKELREAYKKLKKSLKAQFIGNIEGCNVFEGEADVLVTDGFTGNIFLKTAEGLSKFILSKTGSKGLENLNPNSYPGAILCGVKEIVVKCHSYSTPEAIIQGLLGTYDLITKNFILKLKNQLT